MQLAQSLRGLLRELTQHAVFNRKSHFAAAIHFHTASADTFDKLFVAERGVELHEPHAIGAVVREEPGEAAYDVRFPRARDALLHELLLQTKQAQDAIKPHFRKVRFAVECCGVEGHLAYGHTGAAREQGPRIGLRSARECWQKAVEGQQNVAGQFILAEQGGIRWQTLSDRDGLVHRPGTEIGRTHHWYVRREVIPLPRTGIPRTHLHTGLQCAVEGLAWPVPE